MKKSEFLLEVKSELDNIKEQATKEEIGKLDFRTFNHTNRYLCIYGQMTGNCQSIRASDLYDKTYMRIGCNSIDLQYVPFKKQDLTLNQVNGGRFTPLEKYLYMVREPMHKKLIEYLKGDIQEIILK